LHPAARRRRSPAQLRRRQLPKFRTGLFAEPSPEFLWGKAFSVLAKSVTACREQLGQQSIMSEGRVLSFAIIQRLTRGSEFCRLKQEGCAQRGKLMLLAALRVQN